MKMNTQQPKSVERTKAVLREIHSNTDNKQETTNKKNIK